MPIPTTLRFRRTTRRTFRKRPLRFRGKRPTFKKRVATIAKSVHFRETERKWRGFAIPYVVSPALDVVGSSLLVIQPYTLERGDLNSQRIGHQIQSMSMQLKMSLVNDIPNYMWMRVLCLQPSQTSTLPTFQNIFIDIVTKGNQSLTKQQVDMIARVDTDLWRTLYDRKYVLAPRGYDTGGAVISGLNKNTRTFNFYKKRFTRLTYPQDHSSLESDPNAKDVSWVFIFSYPHGISIPGTAVPGEAILGDIELFHNFKDI